MAVLLKPWHRTDCSSDPILCCRSFTFLNSLITHISAQTSRLLSPPGLATQARGAPYTQQTAATA